MARIEMSRTIEAPVDQVFDTVANIERFSKAVPHITSVEFLTESHVGVGTRFTETRVLRGRQATTTLEVTEYVENERVRLVADEGGTVWDTVFTVAPAEGQDQASTAQTSTALTMIMDASPYTLVARILNPLAKGILRRAIAGDLNAVKAYCENGD